MQFVFNVCSDFPIAPRVNLFVQILPHPQTIRLKFSSIFNLTDKLLTWACKVNTTENWCKQTY